MSIKEIVKKIILLSVFLSLIVAFTPTGLADTRTVSQKEGGYRSIQSAINSAKPGDTLLIKGGIYNENLKIDKDLTLRGAGPLQVEIQGKKNSQPVLLVGPSPVKVTLIGLTVEGAKASKCKGSEKGVCSAGISVRGKAKLEAINCSIQNNENHGLLLKDRTQTTLKHTSILDNKKDGIRLLDSSRVEIFCTKIRDNRGYGVHIRDSSRARLTRSTIEENGDWEVILRSSSNIWIRCSRVGRRTNGTPEPEGLLFSGSGHGEAIVRHSVVSGQYYQRSTISPQAEFTIHLIYAYQEQNRSWVFLPLTGGGKVKVYLYAPEEEKQKVENVYCGAPTRGATLYKGNYKLTLDASSFEGDNPPENLGDSTLYLGPQEFVAGTYHDGQMKVVQLDPDTDKWFILPYLYGSCNCERIKVFGYDRAEGSLVEYEFRDQSGDLYDEVSSSPFNFPDKKLYSKSTRGNFVTGCYSQRSGKFEMSEWKFNPDKQVFQEIRHWQEE